MLSYIEEKQYIRGWICRLGGGLKCIIFQVPLLRMILGLGF